MSAHPIPGHDYECGRAYLRASPLRQAEARLDYWRDRKARLDANEERCLEGPHVGEQYELCRAGIEEALSEREDILDPYIPEPKDRHAFAHYGPC